MSNVRSTRSRVIYILGTVVLLLLLVVVSLLAVRKITGRSLGLRSFITYRIQTILNLPRAVADSRNVQASSQGDFTNIVFLHQSVGDNLIEYGNVREEFQQRGYTFWDHHSNPIGLRDPEGRYSDYNYNVPNDNTNPDGLARIFNQRVYPLPVNALSGLMQHEVIAFKSCFPTSDIRSDEQLEQYKTWYLGMRDVMDQHPDKVFIVMSQPPLNPASTNPELATRARSFATWLTSDEFLDGHPNIFTFDLFNHLAESNPSASDFNMLRQEYRHQGTDSHPNRLANATTGPEFVDFIIDSTQTYLNK